MTTPVPDVVLLAGVITVLRRVLERDELAHFTTPELTLALNQLSATLDTELEAHHHRGRLHLADDSDA